MNSARFKFKLKKEKKYWSTTELIFSPLLFCQYIWVVSLKRDKPNKSD